MARDSGISVGQIFVRWTVLREGPAQGKARRWECECVCGVKRLIQGGALKNGNSKSCGCLAKELSRARNKAKPRKVHDIAGLRCGRLVALHRISSTHWWCRCDCGKEKRILEHSLRFTETFSCGCLHSETARENGRKVQTHGHAKSDHSLRSPEYRTWCGMKRRCQNPNNRNYADYGGRGIKVCDRWSKSFEAFLADMGPRPPNSGAGKLREHSIERIDNEKGYEPGNCRWSTFVDQARNRRSNHMLTHSGKTQTITEWALEVGMSKVTLQWRISQGWPPERALRPP